MLPFQTAHAFLITTAPRVVDCDVFAAIVDGKAPIHPFVEYGIHVFLAAIPRVDLLRLNGVCGGSHETEIGSHDTKHQVQPDVVAVDRDQSEQRAGCGSSPRTTSRP